MPFLRQDGSLCANETPLTTIAEAVGTPCYVYDWRDIEARFSELKAALSDVNAHIRYAVKANSNLAILARMVELGAGFDIVSGGELERVIRAGAKTAEIVFSGVGKTTEEISFALKSGVGCFNVESAAEARRIAHIANHLAINASVAIRVNPDISVETHPYIATGMRENKFGMPESEAYELALEIEREHARLEYAGLACHIGSQIADLQPYMDALDALLALRSRLSAVGVESPNIDMGGGFGICYTDETPLSFANLGSLLAERLSDDVTLDVEPGRSLVGAAGVLLTRVEYLKLASSEGYRNFCIVDAAMNDLIRPALYEAEHKIEEAEQTHREKHVWNVVGGVCETGDFLALERTLGVSEGDLLVLKDVGAYGFVMSSNYNSRCRAAEVIVTGEGQWHIARRRESMHDLTHLEHIC